MNLFLSVLKGAWLVGACLATAAVAQPQERLEDFRTVATVQTASNEGLQRLSLPLAVMQQSRSSDLADLRVFDAQGRSVPLAWVPATVTTPPTMRLVELPRFVWPMAPVPPASAIAGSAGGAASAAPAASAASSPAAMQTLPGLKVEVTAAGAVVRIEAPATTAPPQPAAPRAWLVDASRLRAELPQGERVVALSIDWARQPQGVVSQARLEGSDDLTQWRLLAEATLLETAESDGAAVTARRIELSQSVLPKYLRLQLDGALPLSNVTAEIAGAAPEPAWAATQARFLPSAAREGAAPSWTLDLHGSVPVRRLSLSLPELNMVVPLQIERRSGERADWTPAARYTAYRLVRNGRELQAPPVELDAQAARYWRITALHDAAALAGAPLEATLAWQPREIVFAAQGGGSFQLAIGRENATPRFIDVATMVPGYKPGDAARLPLASLGPLQAREVAPRSLDERILEASPAEQRRWTLWAVLTLAVAALGWLAWKLVHDMKSQPRPAAEGGRPDAPESERAPDTEPHDRP